VLIVRDSEHGCVDDVANDVGVAGEALANGARD
jgi:hypothetical protein